MRVLITGHTGFVGRHLKKLVEAEGHDFYGFSTTIGGEIRDYESIRSRIEQVNPDQIHHLAAQAFVPESNTDPRRGFDTNLTGTLNLLEAVRHTGSRAQIHIAGTSEEYGYGPVNGYITEQTPCRPTSVYGVTKLAAGQLGLAYAYAYGIPAVHTRAFNHTGPGHQARYAIPSFARQIARIEKARTDGHPVNVLRHGNLGAVRDYTDVRDVVRAYRVAITRPPGIYNVCSTYTRTLASVLTQLKNLSTTEVVTLSDDSLYRPGMDIGDAPIFHPRADLLNEAGWKPEIPWHQTLADTLDYWRASV